MTYNECKAMRAAAEAELREASMRLTRAGAGSGPSGLTPDSVKATPEYRAARYDTDRAFSRLRRINVYIVATFPNENRADHMAARQARQTA